METERREFGTAVSYRYALTEPVYGRRNKHENFKKVNEALFPNGAAALDIYEWTTDRSDFLMMGMNGMEHAAGVSMARH